MEYKVKHVTPVKFSFLNNQDVNRSTLILRIGTRNFHFNRFSSLLDIKTQDMFEFVKDI